MKFLIKWLYIITFLIIAINILSLASCSYYRFNQADEYAIPVIEAITNYKKEFGRYPKNTRVIKKYMAGNAPSNIYYRLIRPSSSASYKIRVKKGYIKKGETLYLVDVNLKGNVHCEYANGKPWKCAWRGM